MPPIEAAVEIKRPQRWDQPFGEGMSEADVDRVLAVKPFSRIDPERFPPSAPLRGILRNDSRIVRFGDGDIVVREGDYGNSAFFILSGKVRVVLSAPGNQLPASVLGRKEPDRKNFWQTFAQLWRNASTVERRDPRRYRLPKDEGSSFREITPSSSELVESTRVFLQDVPGILSRHRTVLLEAGEMFGEIAALGRTPRNASIFAEGEAELLEIRWQGLRDIKRHAQELRQHIDAMYRERSLESHLNETPIFRHLDEATLKIVADSISFETYGQFDWYGSYKSLAERDPNEVLATEPVIAEEGHYSNGLILVRAGFARVSRRIGHGHRTIGYLGKGQAFGFEEIFHNWCTKESVPNGSTLRALGYVDVLVVPTAIVEKYVLPTLPNALHPPPVTHARRKGGEAEIRPEMLEFLVERRYINGTATMTIDLDRCTRCDDCVRACASTHDGNPRFVRHGHRYDNVMIANACMHCVDPVCMIGCPTGAIHRDLIEGQVVINDKTCIGCKTCANSCPYDNIRMVEIRDARGALIRDEETRQPILKATKCDLCEDNPGGPACERACPHDALRRSDMGDLPTLSRWLNRA